MATDRILTEAKVSHHQLRVDVVQVPCEIFALQFFSKLATLGDATAVSVGDANLKRQVVKNLQKRQIR